MKRIIVLIFLVCGYIMAFGYELDQKKSFGKSLTSYTISENDKDIAQIYLLDPSKNFYFFSVEDRPRLFDSLDQEITAIAKEKNIEPAYVMLGDFSKTIKFKKTFSFGYAWNSLGLLLFAPSYLKRADILNPNNVSKRFFMEIKIDGKEFYSVVIFNRAIDIKNVKRIIAETKNLRPSKFKLYSLLDFPIAVVNFHGKKCDVIYESHKNVKKYSCLYLAEK